MIQRSSFDVTRSVIFALIVREMHGRINARRLGAFWLFFEPVSHVVGIVLLIAIVRGRSIPGFDVPVFLVVGIVPFLMMKNMCLKIMEAIASNKALFAYRQIKPVDTMIARAVVEFTLSACVYILLMFAMGFFLDYAISIARPLEWLFSIFVGVILSFSLGMIMCIIVEEIPEMRSFFRLLFLPLYFISGAVYPTWAMPNNLLPWIDWNPFLHVIDSVRWSTFEWYPKTAGIGIGYAAEVAYVLLFIAILMYRGHRHRLIAL